MGTVDMVLGEVDPPTLAAALNREADFLRPAGQMERLGFGFYSYVFGTESGWIVRVARTADARDRHVREIQALPGIARRLSVPVPLPRVAVAPNESFPFGATAYLRLPGRVMVADDANGPGWEQYADDLAGELAELHAIPADSLQHAPSAADPDHLPKLWDHTSRALKDRLSKHEWEQVERWWDAALRQGKLTAPHVTLTHGDPWWENLMVEYGRLSAVLDWEFLSFADPAGDLGVTLQMGEHFFRRVMGAYSSLSARADPGLEDRARLLGASRVFYGIRFALDRGDEDEWADALVKLRAGPILMSSA
jgi:aminoglycoside 2''-phosphotransferase